MSKEIDFDQALARLDQREHSTRKRAVVATILPFVVALAALGYLVSRAVYESKRLNSIQQSLANTRAELDKAEAQVADIERRKAVLDRETDQVRKERVLLTGDKEKLVAEIESLRGEKERLVQQTKLYESDRTAVREGLHKLTKSIANPLPAEELAAVVPITAVAEPRASANPIPGSKDSYNFRCWLQVPEERRKEIESVRYFFDHPSFRNKEMTSGNAADNFSVQYKGWGALTNVVIEIRLKSGQREKMAFNMFAALGWDR
jgi:cell division protein FtsB